MNSYHKSSEFLRDAKRVAVSRGYNPDFLSLANDGVHKLTYKSPEGIKHFGRLGYGDFLYYKKFQPDIAKQKRNVFRTSHSKITKLHHLNKYSPNELAINILW